MIIKEQLALAQEDNRAETAAKISWMSVAARAAAVVVAAVAGAASFAHIASVAVSAGERPWVAYTLPLAIDGLIVVGVAALLEDKHTGRHGRASARIAVTVGVLATLAANLASAEPTWTAQLVAVAAPVSFLLSVEVLTRTGRPRRTVPDRGQPADPPGGAGPPPSPRAATPASDHLDGPTRQADGPHSSQTRHGPRRQPRTRKRTSVIERTDLETAARTIKAQLAADGKPLSRQRLAEELRKDGHSVSNEHLGRLLATVRDPSPSTAVSRPNPVSFDQPITLDLARSSASARPSRPR